MSVPELTELASKNLQGLEQMAGAADQLAGIQSAIVANTWALLAIQRTLEATLWSHMPKIAAGVTELARAANAPK